MTELFITPRLATQRIGLKQAMLAEALAYQLDENL
jgi:hypothetical protein